MSAGALVLLLVAAALLLATGLSLRTAARSKTLFDTDIGLLWIPVSAFAACLVAFNQPAQTGWAFIVYPFVVLAASIVALFIRVFVLPRIGVPPGKGSVGVLVLVVVAAAALGAFVRPWSE